MPGQRGPVPVAGDRDLPQEILDLLDTKPEFKTADEFPSITQQDTQAALSKLGSRSMVEYDPIDTELVLLTPESEGICQQGSHEYRVWDAIKNRGKVPVKELPGIVGPDSAKVGQNAAFRLKWIKNDGGYLVPIAEEVQDNTRETLQKIKDTKSCPDTKALAEFKKRKLVSMGREIHYKVRKGPKYAKQIEKEETDLTAELLASGDWKTANFKPYNFNALGAQATSGALHPLNKVRTEFRNIFFSEGFIEMPTDRYVESGFWNFDTLFVPQQHPARDMQDTFFISDPPMADLPRDYPEADATMDVLESSNFRLFSDPSDPTSKDSSKADGKVVKTPRDYEGYLKATREVHEVGSHGSIGYRYPWSEDETRKLVLRTHTTAVSTWCLHRLSENPRPCRYFSIDRVFRNETVDATHLAEFHQIEGVIADWGLTLGGLMKFLEDFFSKIGIEGLRFKPAYNPYTEPSMEIFGYHKGLAKWVEIGNSGLFRPEMLETMGLPSDLRIYGFGLSLERPTMIKYGVSNIRDLLGHKVDLGFIEGNPAVRLDK